MKKEARKGQVAIFVIIGIVIVAAIVLFFLVRNDVLPNPFDGGGEGGEFDFRQELKNDIEDNEAINEKIALIANQGGSYEPENYFMFEGNKHEYLCETSEYYKTCYMQQPFLLQHVESEVNIEVLKEVNEILRRTKEKGEREGYDVAIGNVDFSVDFIPGSIVFNIDTNVRVSKGETSKRYEGFEIRKESKLYDIIMLSTAILNYEARYGDADPVAFMALYPKIKVVKKKQGDGTTLYFVSSRESDEKFNFASKSLVWPPGYQRVGQ